MSILNVKSNYETCLFKNDIYKYIIMYYLVFKNKFVTFIRV